LETDYWEKGMVEGSHKEKVYQKTKDQNVGW